MMSFYVGDYLLKCEEGDVAVLLDRIRALRPYLTSLQCELVCGELPADATNNDIIKQPLPEQGVGLCVSCSIADYLARYELDHKLTLREFWMIVPIVERMHKDGATVDQLRTRVNQEIGVASDLHKKKRE
jgi:hypothetical protein